jgi:hypothetical protein
MLQPDWEDEMAKIMSGGGTQNNLTWLEQTTTEFSTDTNEDGDHRYLLFSATFKKDMRKLARKYLSIDHICIRIGRAGSAHSNVIQRVSPLRPLLKSLSANFLNRSSGATRTTRNRPHTTSFSPCHLLAPSSSATPREVLTTSMTSCTTWGCLQLLSTLIAPSESVKMHCTLSYACPLLPKY